MRAKKSLGQNFLMHARIAERIADTAELPHGIVVLEVGPGTGKLTRALLMRAEKVIAVEADHTLLPTLRETFAQEIEEGRLELVCADIRTFDPSCIKGPYAVVANIPYYITGEIIRQFLTADHKPISMTLLVQKEVAERIARAKKESLLSLSVKVYGVPTYCFTVPRGAFVPSPNVDSAVLSIRAIDSAAFSSRALEQHFFAVLRAGFAHKRKLLAGNLSVLFSPEAVKHALARSGIAPKARAEDIPLSAWKQVAKLLAP